MNNNRNNYNEELLLKLLTPLKLKHDTLFHDYYANTNKFCQINPKKILTNPDFVQYVFRNKYYKWIIHNDIDYNNKGTKILTVPVNFAGYKTSENINNINNYECIIYYF